MNDTAMNTVRFTEENGYVVVDLAARVCERCVLPGSFPDAELDADGVCHYCRAEDERLDDSRELVDDLLSRSRSHGADYDCLLLYSGGKDSSLSLIELARNRGLRVLALTLDNGFLAQATAANMRAVLDSVGADHITLRPHRRLMHGVYRSALTGTFGPETVKYSTAACGSCIGMVFAAGMRTAAAYGIPLLAGGWTPGQMTTSAFVPASFLRGVVDLNLDPRVIDAPGLDSWTRDSGELPHGLVNPLYATDYREDKALAVLAAHGWSAPGDTDSCSTNCRLNGLLILDHLRKHGYHPYAYELAHHVRLGAMSRDEALRKMRHVRIAAQSIGPVALELGIPSPLQPAAAG
ncbi:hypothetical protein [Actinoplanes sp. N902-109]|uniref:hypothetical protein n=1 Tax=Actinoplanes sp. (strain N902-109) TaxID=649831 RepID=UPI0003294FE7|nr:hypothetical protein [Actinoplanes sp. N902-109]AGL19163.1 hypothetical protein L083_5653 [Actinoplanes sp. N902-109]